MEANQTAESKDAYMFEQYSLQFCFAFLSDELSKGWNILISSFHAFIMFFQSRTHYVTALNQLTLYSYNVKQCVRRQAII